MYRILIVDDEPLIVDSLFHLLSEQKHLELDLCRAYTVTDAQAWLERARIDIVLSDMRMPGMSGVELQKAVLLKWPRCRVIFFTAYDDLTYAQQAIQIGKVSAYLTKNVDNKEIVQAVQKAMGEIDHEVMAADTLIQANIKMKRALPILRQNFLLKLLRDEGSVSVESLQAKFAELEMELHPEQNMFLLMCRIDAWKDDMTPSDKTLLQYAVQNIAEEFLQPFASFISLDCDDSKLLWIMQPTTPSSRGSVFGTLESVQLAGRNLLNLSLSFALSAETASWDDIREAFHRSRQLLSFRVNSEDEMLIDLNHEAAGIKDAGVEFPLEGRQTRTIKQRINDLDACIESGQKKAFFETFSAFMSENTPNDSSEALELYFALGQLFMSYLNRTGTMAEVEKEMSMRPLTAVSEQCSWPDISEFFFRLANHIFARHEAEQLERSQKLINRVHHFIQNHLDEDLSLTRIAALVHHSPTYFSRVYKRMTGFDLSEYIAEQRIAEAKELLRSTGMKIYEITAKVGYESVPYFIRLFKKHTSMTPQEFRDYNQ